VDFIIIITGSISDNSKDWVARKTKASHW